MTLLAAYNFDEASGNVLDVTGNGRGFTPDASITRQTGHTNTGLRHESTAANSVGPAIFGQTAQRTLMAWVKRTSNSVDGWIVEMKDSVGDTGIWGFLFTGGNVQARAKTSGGTAGGPTIAQPTAGTWYHLAMTYDGSTIRIFVNGTQSGSAAFTGPVGTQATIFPFFDTVGTETVIDDVRVYDTALDAATITTLMNTPVSGANTKAVGTAAEADAAQAIGRRKTRTVGSAAETDAAQPITRRKVRAIATATETDAAVTVARTKVRAVGPAGETDTARPAGRVKTRALGVASELDSSVGIARTKVRSIGTAAETDLAQPITKPTSDLGIATEADTAQPIGRRKIRAIGAAVESDAAQTIARVRRRAIGTATEADTALLVTVTKRRLVGTAGEIDIALPFLPAVVPPESVLTATNHLSSTLTIAPHPALAAANAPSSLLEVTHGV